LVCYGNCIDGFCPYVSSELIDLYKFSNSMVIPSDITEDLPPRITLALQKISSKLSPELSTLLRRIKTSDENLDDDMKKVLKWYSGLFSVEQSYVTEVLTKLLDLGMYMRGWEGKDDSLPIKRRPYTSKVDGFVTMAFWPVMDLYKDSVGKKILNLPLYRYSYGTWKKSKEEKDGITIWERLVKVRKNDDVYACIRMSSNWFICSAYKYMVLFGMPEPFDLQQTDYIS